jgi:hypothetical protein
MTQLHPLTERNRARFIPRIEEISGRIASPGVRANPHARKNYSTLSATVVRTRMTI